MATIASAPKNDFGMVGAAPSIDVVSVRASRDGRTFTGLDVHAAVQLCITKRSAYNIKVVSLSLGGDGSTIAASIAQRTEFQDTIDNARLYGLNVVAAAGNSERGVVDWPAGYTPTFAVGAATGTGARCSFASWGTAVDLWAPGCPLDVGRPDGTGVPAWASGSSEATAFVAAVLAQMRGLDSGLGVDASEQAMRSGGRDAEAGLVIDVGAAFRASTRLTVALSTGHSAIPLSGPVVPSSTASDSQPTGNDSPSNEANRAGDVTPPSSQPASAGLSVTQANHVPDQLPRPVVRSVAVRQGWLSLRLVHRPANVDARVDVYARQRGKAFPRIAKRARFRADNLRIRVSGSISQLSIGYRDPSGVRARSVVIVVHLRT